MISTTSVVRGREAFARRRWVEAFSNLSAAEQESPLDAVDYEQLVITEYLLSTDAAGVDTWERAHHVFLARNDVERAARATFWLAMNLVERGEMARGAGWVARGRRLLDDAKLECSARGYLMIPSAIQAAVSGDAATALAICEEAIAIGQRFGDQDLVTILRHGQGRTLLQAGRLPEGLALVDEVMITVSAGEVSPMVVGIIYCGIVDSLHQIYDSARVQEWTDALTRWCEEQPEMVMYRGRCMVHRAELFQMHGDWPAALEQSQQAAARFLGPPVHPAAREALYREAEVHRLRGAFAQAREAYRRAAELGHSAQPGMALLGLAEGRVDAAEAAIGRLLAETASPPARAGILPAFVDIALAAGNVEAARAAAAELGELAADLGSDHVQAQAAAAAGAALLAGGEAGRALGELRHAAATWQKLDAPYEAAKVQLLLGLACRELGDEDGAKMAIDAARDALQRLGAAPDLARLRALTPARPAGAPAGLTGREVQLLALLATGRTNRELAAELRISDKTVARHVSNIFNKLGVSSRAAATAYAFKHELV